MLSRLRGESQNFADYSWLVDVLSGQDGVVNCLGTYTGSVQDEELRKITTDYTADFARPLHASSPDAAFSFLSGIGADQSGQSRLAFARYKGKAESHYSRLISRAFTSFGLRISSGREAGLQHFD